MGTSRASQAGEGSSAGASGREAATLDARVLGAFEVAVNGRLIVPSAWHRTSSVRLVKLLLLTPGHHMTREAAAERLWPEQPPGRSQVALRKALLYARDALDRCPVLESSRLAIAMGPGLRLDLDDLQDALIGTVDERRHAGRAAPIPTAVSALLSAGLPDVLPDDAPEPWIDEARERLRGTWQAFALPLARRLHAGGARDEAHLVIERVLQSDPADEAAHQVAMELYATEGRLHAAREQFARCRVAVRRELDSEPSEDTVAVALAAERTPHPTDDAPTAEDRLVDRVWQMAQIRDGLLAARAGTVTSMVVRGPTGIGKSRVITESIREARLMGWQVLQWRAPADGRAAAYAPLTVGLAAALHPDDVVAWQEPARSALAGIVPGLVAGPVLAFRDAPAKLAGVVAALVRLALERPLVLAWDDLVGIDPATLSVLDAIVAVRPQVPLFVLASVRDDEPVPRRAAATLDRLRRAGAAEILADPLAAGELGAVVAGRLGGGDVDPALGRQLAAAGGGNPLFAIELAEAWRDAGQILLVDGRWMRIRPGARVVAPGAVVRIVAQRFARVTPDARTILQAASSLPDGASIERIGATTSLDRVALGNGIDGAVASGLLIERDDGIAFANPLFRAAVRAHGRART